jgi:hypothetical protein
VELQLGHRESLLNVRILPQKYKSWKLVQAGLEERGEMKAKSRVDLLPKLHVCSVQTPVFFDHVYQPAALSVGTVAGTYDGN